MLERAEAQAVEAERGEPIRYDAAIATLEELRRRYPGSPEALVALQQLGYFVYMHGDVERALALWLEVVCPSLARAATEEALRACRPSSGFSPSGQFDVWSRLGEAWFDASETALAAAAYERALAVAPAEHANLGVVQYRFAWSLYRLDRYDAALAAFARVRDPRLEAEATEFMAMIMTDPEWSGANLDRPEVRPWIESWERAPVLVLRIAELYGEMQENALARRACEHFLMRWPDDPRAARAREMLARIQP